ncbi:PREDICTED: uncharacterized protein LOC104759286 [Camelina sativa]|uniref:Uncharacterized protein LOC104759286 n=1 Tax=Camelina sativa TaxID=90675 RepID=A0ABM0X4J4_CAMSA|nr:PREDICTED: uncharacterized protein LOC104759286 [Camelina sativa]
MEFRNSGSWIWKSIGKLRHLARPFIVYKLGTGITCNFWSDNWTGMGSLLEITQGRGPAATGLPKNAVVAEALREGQWWISQSRSRNPIIQLVKQCLPLPSVVDTRHDGEDDCFLWKVGEAEPSDIFSTATTWDHLNPPLDTKDWYEAVWFKEKIPKHAFVAWLAALNRLTTKDRLISWGLAVPPHCLLCGNHEESRQHLFFDCVYAEQVWQYFYSRAAVTPPNLFLDALVWLKRPCRNRNVAAILKLTFQASIYLLWKERNSRLHTSTSRPPVNLIQEIKVIIRSRLEPFSRIQNARQVLLVWRHAVSPAISDATVVRQYE